MSRANESRCCCSLEMNSSHIPLRDSKMTRMLSKALSGRWLCATVTHVAMDSYEESEAVLLLAMKFGSITFSTRSKDDKRLEDVAGKKQRIQHLCGKVRADPVLASLLT